MVLTTWAFSMPSERSMMLTEGLMSSMVHFPHASAFESCSSAVMAYFLLGEMAMASGMEPTAT